MKLVALFHPSVKYLLIESYGPDCFVETNGMLKVDISYTSEEYTIKWLLGFGDKVKVLQPIDLAQEIQRIAKKIIQSYEGT